MATLVGKSKLVRLGECSGELTYRIESGGTRDLERSSRIGIWMNVCITGTLWI